MNLTNLPFEIKLNIVAMCRLLKKIFGRKPAPEPSYEESRGNMYALFFAINDYPGKQNDLNGCLNDQEDMIRFVTTYRPDVSYRAFKDKNATAVNFRKELKSAIDNLKDNDTLWVHVSSHGTQIIDRDGDEGPDNEYDEGICFYDETIIDDDIREILMSIKDNRYVVFFLDCCFSQSNTRAIHVSKPRFMISASQKLRRNKKVRFTVEEMKWIAWSACKEYETAADAYVDGKYNGIFTYFLPRIFKPDMTYRKWGEEMRKHLPSCNYSQTPVQEGKQSILDRKVFY